MKYSYVQGLDDTEKADVRSAFLEAFLFRKRMIEVIDNEIRSINLSMESETLYDSPNWDKLLVGKIEKIKALKWLQSFLSEKDL